MIKPKTFILFIIIFGLIINGFNFFVRSEPIDIGDISDKNFYLIDAVKTGDMDKDFTLKLGFDKSIGLTTKDISYKLVADKENISSFLDCVDVKYSVENGVIEFIGEVKKFGIYSVDIQPVIKDVLTLDNYVWWNSTFSYLSGSCITNNVTNYAMMLNISYSTGGDLSMNGHCQANFSDIRFVSEDNTTELYHWIEYQSNSNYAIFWINISDEDYINCYYGSDVNLTNSSFNNPVNVFYLWENFTSITDWTNYAGGGFEVSNGYLYANSTNSYLYMYRQLVEQDYFFKILWCETLLSGVSAYNGISIEQDAPSGSWADLSNNEYGSFWYSNERNYRTASKNNAGTWKTILSQSITLSTWYKNYAEYNGNIIHYENNNYIITSNTHSGLTNYPNYLSWRMRQVANLKVKADWLIVGLHVTPEPVFCNWELITYCEYSNSVVNESPTDESIVSGINVSYITGELVVLDGEADSINISLVADNGLFYINDTSDVYNGTYSLNVMLANFSTETTYIYYINITNGGCFVSYDFSFETVYFGGYTEFQILSWKINNIYEDMLGEGDFMDIGISIEIIGIVLSMLIFIFAYYSDKDKFLKPILFFMDVPLCLAIGVYYIGSINHSIGFWIGVFMFLFSILLSFAGLYYGLGFGKKNKNK